jgi:hypothetical protein
VREERRRRARGGEEVLMPLYRAKGKGAEAVAWELGRPAINGSGGGSVEGGYGRGRGGRW